MLRKPHVELVLELVLVASLKKKFYVLAIQSFTPTAYDWRVGVLGNGILYVCKYMIPKGKWKHGAKLGGKSTII